MKRLPGWVRISLVATGAAILLAGASTRLMGAGASSGDAKPAAGPPSTNQAAPPEAPDSTPDHSHMMQHMMHMRSEQGDLAAQPAEPRPTLPGQDAFGAIQEIVHILEADPKTDWSKVDLESLRKHLIDMNEVTLNAEVLQWPINGGFSAAVTGSGRTLDAIQRMVPAHARTINGRNGWKVEAEMLENGVILTVATRDPNDVARVRGLGFIGVLVRGSHHRLHHLAMARGLVAHGH